MKALHHTIFCSNRISYQFHRIKNIVPLYDDFRRTLARYGSEFTDEQFKRVCRLYDQNGCGSITYESFEKLFKGTDKILSAIKDKDASLLSRLFLLPSTGFL